MQNSNRVAEIWMSVWRMQKERNRQKTRERLLKYASQAFKDAAEHDAKTHAKNDIQADLRNPQFTYNRQARFEFLDVKPTGILLKKVC